MTTFAHPPGAMARLHTASGGHSLALRGAHTFFSRLRGLMLAPALGYDQGLLLTGCPSVHCAFMLHAIDVVYLDAQGRVLKCVAQLKPWRVSFSNAGRDAQGRRHVRAAHTLELAAGSIARLGVCAGDQLEHPHWSAALPAQRGAWPAQARPPTQPVQHGIRPAQARPPTQPVQHGIQPAQARAPARPPLAVQTRAPQLLQLMAPQAHAAPSTTRAPAPPRRAQRGASMVEFVVVGPLLTLLGLALLQYGMLFFAKSQINHAGFMAARAGSTGNANIDSVRNAYEMALVPLYGGGQTVAELATALSTVKADVEAKGGARIELLNPTTESFIDWGDAALQAKLGTGASRVIPNSNQAFKGQTVGGNSGQTIQDANLIKLRITHGYLPKVPIVANLYKVYLKWVDPKTDPYYTALVAEGRIPVVSNVTLQMQSDAIEGTSISNPGAGNGGTPTNPGDPPVSSDPPPTCTTIGCTGGLPPLDPGTPCTGPACPACPGPG